MKISKLIDFITVGIWTKDEQEYNSKWVRWFVRQAKVLIITVQGYGEDQILVRSAALTFYTMMSLVPLAALIFSFAKGLSLETNIKDYLFKEFPQYDELINQVLSFANALIERTQGGLLAIISLIVLMWSVIRVFINVEGAFNHIWEVKQKRSFTRKMSDYTAVMVIAPLLWVVSISIGLHIQDYIKGINIAPLSLIFKLAPFIVTWIMLTLVYTILPNTKVKFWSALGSAIIVGTVFQLFQIIYFYVQSELSSYNAIYGSFAALPMFLLWLQASWQIIFFGAELSFAYQNIKKYQFEREVSLISYKYRLKIAVTVMIIITRHYVNSESKPHIDLTEQTRNRHTDSNGNFSHALSSEQISLKLNLPIRIVRDVIFDLEKAGFVVAIGDNIHKKRYYVPAKDVHNIRLYDLIAGLQSSGLNSLNMHESEDVEKISELIESMGSCVKNEGCNKLITDI